MFLTDPNGLILLFSAVSFILNGNAQPVVSEDNVNREEFDRLWAAAEVTNTFHNNKGFLPLHHNIGIDLYFVFDTSSSVGELNFQRAKHFAKGLIKEIGVTNRSNSLRVGAMVFHSVADIKFHTVELDDTRDVVRAINSISYTGGGSNMALAFDVLLNAMLPQSRRLNRPGSLQKVFLFTDGYPTEGGNPLKNVRLLKDEGISFTCIGISAMASRRFLRDIAGEPLEEHLFFFQDYFTLSTLIKVVTNQTIDYSECGISPRSHSLLYLEKVPSHVGSWPWQVLIDIYEPSAICGGTLIKPDWILTAASCVQEASSLRVFAGITRRGKARDGMALAVSQTIIHPDFNSTTWRNDIALIRLQRPVTLNVNVRPICLPDPTKEARLLHRGSAVMTGWGHNGVVPLEGIQVDEYVAEDILQELTLPLRRREECELSLTGHREEAWFDESMTCAGYLNRPVGPCVGDTGGPLMKYARVDNDERRWVLIGINSWGMGCALPDELDFFTNVPRFVGWINDNTVV